MVSLVNTHRKEFFGRVSSVIKQIEKDFRLIDEARKVMKDYPTIKTGLRTVALVGFPNVGKTTLLYRLTGSKPEISSYAFTTKGINLGNLIGNVEGRKEKIQVLDTPGTLNRFFKMNRIEKIAHLAIRHLTESLVYVFDLTESYPLADQLKLYDNLKSAGKPIVCALSKQDLLEKRVVENFVNANPDKKIITETDEIMAWIKESK